MKHFSREEIEGRVSPSVCLELMRGAFLLHAEGAFDIDPKHAFKLTKGFVGSMMATERSGDFTLIKVIGGFPDSISTHQGLALLFNHTRGELVASFEAGGLTALRTSATTALALQFLSWPNARHLALVGAGEAALYHARAIAQVRTLESISIFNRTPSRAEKLHKRLMVELPGVQIQSYSLQEKEEIKRADLVVLATSSSCPLLRICDLGEANFIASVGASTRGQQELHNDILKKATVIVDDEHLAKLEAGNLSGLEDLSLLNLGTILLDPAQRPKGLVCFNSTGAAFQDLVCAKSLYQGKL